MENSVSTAKKNLRLVMQAQRDRMTRSDRKRMPRRYAGKLWDLIQQRRVQVIHSYLTMGSELNVLPLLQQALDAGITVVVPKTLRKRQMQNLVLRDLKNMEPGIFGTYHPRDAAEYHGRYDLIIVAGLAFDARGYRVGYGGGYYDTFLASQPDACKVGVLFPFQLLPELPVEPHDIRVDQLIGAV